MSRRVHAIKKERVSFGPVLFPQFLHVLTALSFPPEPTILPSGALSKLSAHLPAIPGRAEDEGLRQAENGCGNSSSRIPRTHDGVNTKKYIPVHSIYLRHMLAKETNTFRHNSYSPRPHDLEDRTPDRQSAHSKPSACNPYSQSRAVCCRHSRRTGKPVFMTCQQARHEPAEDRMRKQLTGATCPLKDRRNLPSRAFQSFVELSHPALAMSVPSGENCTWLTLF